MLPGLAPPQNDRIANVCCSCLQCPVSQNPHVRKGSIAAWSVRCSWCCTRLILLKNSKSQRRRISLWCDCKRKCHLSRACGPARRPSEATPTVRCVPPKSTQASCRLEARIFLPSVEMEFFNRIRGLQPFAKHPQFQRKRPSEP